MSNPPAGWFPAPDDPSRWRWWDGSAWTDNYSEPARPSIPESDGPLWTATTLWVDEVVKYFNARVTLSLRDAAGQELAVLAPEAKNDREFSITDPAGTQVGRVVATENKRKLLSQDRRWWVSLARPLPQPLDQLALGVATNLADIQLKVVNWADTRFD